MDYSTSKWCACRASDKVFHQPRVDSINSLSVCPVDKQHKLLSTAHREPSAAISRPSGGPCFNPLGPACGQAAGAFITGPRASFTETLLIRTERQDAAQRAAFLGFGRCRNSGAQNAGPRAASVTAHGPLAHLPPEVILCLPRR